MSMHETGQPMPEPSFEFCALKFLNQWQEYECQLYEKISAVPGEKDVDDALKYFGVARTFKKSDERLPLILNALIDVRNNKRLSLPEDKVENLASTFDRLFGKRNISAASKLLWLSFRAPFIIYDRRAVNALRRCGHKITDYSEYSRIWRKEYLKNEGRITAAVEKLQIAGMFMRYPLSDGERIALTNEAWFEERVFDIFLWEIGNTLK